MSDSYFTTFTAAQQRVLRHLAEGHAISFDGNAATQREEFIDPRTFIALLRKDAIRYDPRTNHHVAAGQRASATLYAARQIRRINRLAQTWTEVAYQDLAFEISGSMNPAHMNDAQRDEMLERLTGRPAPRFLTPGQVDDEVYPFELSPHIVQALTSTGPTTDRLVSETGSLATTAERNADLARIHILAQKLRYSLDEYRDQLERLTGLRSCRYMTAEQRSVVLDAFETGNTSTPATRAASAERSEQRQAEFDARFPRERELVSDAEAAAILA